MLDRRARVGLTPIKEFRQAQSEIDTHQRARGPRASTFLSGQLQRLDVRIDPEPESQRERDEMAARSVTFFEGTLPRSVAAGSAASAMPAAGAVIFT